jgi:hypothetical protein
MKHFDELLKIMERVASGKLDPQTAAFQVCNQVEAATPYMMLHGMWQPNTACTRTADNEIQEIEQAAMSDFIEFDEKD